MKTFWGTGATVLLGVFCLTGCGGGNSETKLADSVTRAVYNNDMATVQSNFDSSLAPKVTRASLGLLSDKMHSLGNFQGLTETATDLPARRYMFDAKFDKGDMSVAMRLDPDGKIAAYRVVAGAPQ